MSRFRNTMQKLADLPLGHFREDLDSDRYIVGVRNEKGLSYYMVYKEEAFANRIATGTVDDKELLSCHLSEFLQHEELNRMVGERLDMDVVRSTGSSFYLSHETHTSFRKLTRITSSVARALAGHFFCGTLVPFPEDYKPKNVHKAFNFYIHYAGDNGYISLRPNSTLGYLLPKSLIETLTAISKKEGRYELARIVSL